MFMVTQSSSRVLLGSFVLYVFIVWSPLMGSCKVYIMGEGMQIKKAPCEYILLCDVVKNFWYNRGMKKIPLTRGKVAVIDDKDYVYVEPFKWCAMPNGTTWYAITNVRCPDGKQRQVRMHRLLMGVKRRDGMEVDHVNHNGLDNRRNNLRVCTHQQNMCNGKAKRGKSRFRGLSWDASRQWWRVSLRVYGRDRYVGIYKDEMQAALGYDLAALRTHKEYACCNLMDNLIGRTE